MAISFGCQHCGKRLKAPESAVGKTSKCPRCHKPVTCPRPSAPARAFEEPDVPEILDDIDPYEDVVESNPYAAPKAREEEIELPHGPAGPAPRKKKKKRQKRKGSHSGYAGVWDRIAAAFVDGVVLSFVLLPSAIFILIPTMAKGADNPAQPPEPAVAMRQFLTMQLTIQLLIATYFVGMESSPYQATLGKMFVGAQVTDLDGYRISVPRAIVRYLVKNFISGICFIGYIIACFDDRTQTLHDKLAGTLVVK